MKKQTISHEDIQRALAHFRRSGGTIQRLPEQVQPARTTIGEKWGLWESDLAAVLPVDEGAPARPGL